MIVMAASFGAAKFFGGSMKKIKLLIVTLCMLMVFCLTSVVSFAASLTIEAAQEYYAGLSGDDISVLQSGYTWSESDGVVTAVLNADTSQSVSFWYDEIGMMQYSGFFGSSEEDTDSSIEQGSSSVIETGISQTGSILNLVGSVTDFVVGNDLCLISLGFVFVGRAAVVLRKCLRVTPC